ncbi:drug resistance transporter, EmrB/QacA subfamily [Alkalibacterium thalassium]|uniref:Drug resistance transporter, EmrB/QacA subfamily n=1 Tax=Alkalibacterium thalassium TaxID=426701 RepID=A0A1G8V1A8_9LACT|nr:drug resistance transporter, EmrB/QacA subfamily [Alkalibacterium thalassium]
MDIRRTKWGRKAVFLITKQLDRRDNNEVPYWMVYTALFAGSLMVIMNQTAIKTALPTMINDLNVSPSIGQWTVSGYTLVKGIMVPITAFAMNKFRSRNLFVLMMIVFGAGSFIAGLGINFAVVLFGAILQGVGAGMVIPLMQTIILTVSPPEKRGSALGLMGVVLGLGPTLGPALGGWIVDTLSWHFIFYGLFIGSAVVIPIAILTLTDVLPMSDPRIDWVSIRHSLIGFGVLLFGLSIMGSQGFDSIVAWVSVVIGSLFIYLFIRRNLHSPEPMLNVSLFKNRTFSLAVIITMLGLMVITGISNVMPMYIQTVLGRSATLSGLILLPGGMFKAFISPVTGRIYDRYGVAKVAPLGGLALFAGTALLVFVGQDTSIWYIVAVYLLLSIGFGVFNIPVTTAGMNALPDDQMGHGTSARQTVRQIGSSFAITLVFASMSIVSAFANTPTLEAAEAGGAKPDLTIEGIRGGFGMVTVLALAAFILTFFLREKTVRQK